MPTPVSSARQCLTQESVAVLDEAVAVARRRGHAQTTSLHMVSSLLSLPNSSLHEACNRTRNNAYSSRLQFKALELFLSVSLDRLPSSHKVDEPPVSNSLMAAIKRSQANQRRQPENFTFYQQQQQQQQQYCSSVPVVKVELQNLIISILDDPLVSRVFGEAGFRSYDIKMATLRPGNSTFYLMGCTPRYKRPSPPLFLCSDEMGGKGFSFPFMGCFSGDENSRRISEVMLRDKKKSPLLLGVSACDALRSFLETVQMKITGVLPDGLSGLSVVCVKDEIFDEGLLKLWLEELERMAENVTGGGILVNFGDLSVLVEDGGVDVNGLRYFVSKLGRLVEVYSGKLWLIGAAASYEVYFKILNKFPTIEQDWDMGILPITSLKFSYPRSSLMESFVPLGGFFSFPAETKSPSSSASQYVVRCHLCNEKYEQEVAALSKGGLRASVAEQYQSSLPSWLAQSCSSSLKGTDDRLLLNAKIIGLQKKWDGICQQHHLNRTLYNHQLSNFRISEGRKEKDCSDNSNESPNEQGNKKASSSLSTDLQKSSSLDMLSKANNPSILSKSSGTPMEFKGEPGGLKSPTSVTSVTTDLGLGIISALTSREPDKSVDQSRLDQENQMHFYVKDPKLLYRALVERVGQQEEAISSIVETITQRERGKNVWINVRGADRFGKKKLGLALAEILYGSRESLVYVDLSFGDETSCIDTLFNSQVTNKYDLTMRGTVVDYLVEKLSKKPSVVFLENIDKADPVVQNCLSQAVKSGRFIDLCGRDVNVSNCVFLGATSNISCGNKSSKYTEEDVVSAKGCLIQISIRFDLNDDLAVEDNTFLMNKRRLVERDTSRGECEVTKRAHKTLNSILDLNLPAEESAICNIVESDTDSSCENSRSWLEYFDRQVDQTVVFKSFDFETLAEKFFKKMTECLHSVVGYKCSIEIETKVMQQLLAAAYSFGHKRVEDWIQHVVRQGFLDATGHFGLNTRSIVKLGAFEGVVSEEKTEGLLPARIIMK